MRAAEILRKLADIVDSAEQEGGQEQGPEQGNDPMDNSTMSRMKDVPEPAEPEDGQDKMVPPLQQKHELLKKVAGVDNEYDRQAGEEEPEGDDMMRMKKMAGIVIAGDENEVN